MASVRPGDLLAGKYRVERVLGTGGMGYVVAARHLQLDQLVAMKFLRKGIDDNDETSTRFLREAKACAKLKNEHIAKVFDVGTLDGGEPYIVMEHLDGCDLAALAKQRGTIPVAEACEYVLQACEALAEAHSLRIVHRDIKLANLFVTRGPAGSPLLKVLDFGISKMNPFGESEHEMTRTSAMLGSPRFMSPEQMRDPRAVDGRTDLWSLGVVLYRLVAGKPPFEAETLGRLIQIVMNEREPPLGTVVPDLPPGFEQVVGKCLEKELANRYANVSELAYALVPYAFDALSARAAADRIAAMLSVPQAPRTGETAIPMPMPLPFASAPQPPAQTDTGTAAPWVGTHGGGTARPPAQRNALAWIGVAMASILLGSCVFFVARNGFRPHATEARSVTTSSLAAEPPRSAAPEAEPAAPLAHASPAPPPTGTAAFVEPTPVKQATATPVATVEGARRVNNAAPTRRPATRSSAPVRVDDGIPSTRD